MTFISRYRLSISKRLTLWYGFTLLLLMSLFACFAYFAFHTSLHHDFDRHLTHEQRMLTPFLRIADGVPSFDRLSELRSVAYQTDGVYGTYVRLFSAQGRELYRSPNFHRHTRLPVRIPRQVQASSISRLWEDRPLRSHYTPLRDEHAALSGWLEVSGFEWSMHQELARLGEALVVGILLSLLLSVGGGYLLARRALRPVSMLTDAANRIRAHDLGARLPTRFGVEDELTDLARTLNSLIERLEASLSRERRFTSNAAHELLTPLTTMRNSVEIVLRRRRDVDAYEDKFQQMLLDVDELIDTVRGLLQLSRIDRLKDLPQEPVDLSRVAREHVGRFHERAEAQGIHLKAHTSSPAFTSADPVRLGEVVDNLIDNALKYTPEGGCVDVSVRRNGAGAIVEVKDTGVGFDPEQGRQLFDRFYRADTPEVQSRSGSGLGLSIVQAIVQVYGGTITATSDGRMQGSTFEVRLPLVSSNGA